MLILIIEKIDTAFKALSSSKIALRVIGLTNTEIYSLKKQIAELNKKPFLTGKCMQ